MDDNLLGPEPNKSSYEKLDWFTIVDSIASNAHFDVTKEALRTLPVKNQENTISSALRELRFFVDEHSKINEPINRALKLLPSSEASFRGFEKYEKSTFGDKDSLNFCCLLLESMKEMPTSLHNYFEYHQFTFYDAVKRETPLKKFISNFRRLVDQKGSINYSSHPELSKLAQDVSKIEQEIKVQLSKVSRTSLFKDALQYPEHDVLNDRYVLAVRSDSYQAKLGPIIAHSSSGLTLFVEPMSIRSLGDKRIELEYKIDEFLTKKFNEFGDVIHEYFSLLHMFVQLMVRIDSNNAKAHYSVLKKFCFPNIVNTDNILIKDFFHPLLEDPITNTLDLKEKQKGLVISGPNTGGKTVSLKVITLCHLFLHYGMYVPAAEAQLRVIDELYFFSHDNQDISKGLSSFSSEALRYLHLIDHMGENALVVVDEIFNSTSSEEASALAMGIVSQVLTRKNSRICLSTHHKILKTRLYKENAFVSCHVGFDNDTHSPTYKLIFGEPGSSLALSIFKNLSVESPLGQTVLDIASKELAENEGEYEELLGELTKKNQELSKLIGEQKRINLQLENQQKDFNHHLQLKKDKLYQDYKAKLNTALKKAEDYYYKFKNSKELPSKNRLNKDLADISHGLSRMEEDVKVSNKPAINRGVPDSIELNQFYFSEKFQKDVKVLKVNQRKKQYQVSSGKINAWVDASDLFTTKRQKQESTTGIIREEKSQISYDVRGMRLDEFQRLAEDSVDSLLAGDIPFLEIIHGHGDGILKGWLRKHLEKFKELSWDHPEGNDGITRVKFS